MCRNKQLNLFIAENENIKNEKYHKNKFIEIKSIKRGDRYTLGVCLS